MLDHEVIVPIHELIKRQSKLNPDKVAYSDRRSQVTYRQLESVTGNLASNLQDLKVNPGDTVAILLPNSTEWIESCFAIVRAGAIAVPISYDSTVPELIHKIKNSNCCAIITTDEKDPIVTELKTACENLSICILVDRGTTEGHGLRYSHLRNTPGTSTPVDSNDIHRAAFVIYTSGTGGNPKGTLINQHGMQWVTKGCWIEYSEMTEKDRQLSPLPLFHIFGLSLTVLATLTAGSSAHLVEKFSTVEIMSLLETDRYTILPGVPTMFHYLLEAAKHDLNFNFPSMRMCVSAGSSLPVQINKDFEKRFGVPLYDSYGTTEASSMITMNPVSGPRVYGSVGKPLPGFTARIVDPNTLEDAEEGELIVQGNMMMGYLNDPESTAKVIRNGWHHTGDLARQDSNGYITITGRLRELVIRGGQNIAPAEVEDVVRTYNSVLDCAVVGLPHQHLGEVPAAFVVARPGETIVSDEIIAHCRTRLSPYKVPASIHVVKEIPRTGSGKILRFKLKESVV